MILLPEIPFAIENVCQAIHRREAAGRSFSVVVVAEGVRLPERDSSGKPLPKTPTGQAGNSIAQAIRERVDKEVRVTVLGHLQRGGSPSPSDRILAARFGASAVELVARGAYGHMVSLRSERIESVPLAEAISPTRLVDPESEVVQSARALGISFGDRS